MEIQLNENNSKFKFWAVLCYLTLVLLLNACAAGRHSLPPHNYSSSMPENTIRMVVDQYGNIYPPSGHGDDWEKCYKHRYFGYKRSFELDKGNDYGCPNFRSHEFDEFNQEIIKTLNEKLKGKERLVVLTHGFNVSFKAAEETNINVIKPALNLDNSLVLEVYWDALYSDVFAGKFPMRWFKSLTYSNYAGQVGLRRVLNGITEQVELVFLTHSRGAAVAMSTIFDPLYNKGIGPESGDYPESFSHEAFKNIKLVMIAPAIGNGHLLAEAEPEFGNESSWIDLLSHIQTNELGEKLEIFNLYNISDVATCKGVKKYFFFPSTLGDTSFGCNEKYVEKIKENFSAQNVSINPYQIDESYNFFIHGTKSHSAEVYLGTEKGKQFLQNAGIGH